MSLADSLSDLASAAGVGALAGLAGTAAMTVSSTLEAKARGREPSETPAAAAGKVLGVQPTDDKVKKRFNNFAHSAYGPSWGTVRDLLDLPGLHGAPAAAAHISASCGVEQIVLPVTGASSPAWKWGNNKEIAHLQTGIIGHLPEPLIRLFDADRVDASGEAYVTFGTADAALGIASYAATLALAAMGDARRSERRPALTLLFTAKVLANAAAGAALTVEQATRHRRFCGYCLIASALSLLAMPPALRGAFSVLAATPVHA